MRTNPVTSRYRWTVKGTGRLTQTLSRSSCIWWQHSLSRGKSRHRGELAQPMLTVAQTAALLGASRTTVIRKADAGELPCVVVSRGHRKKMRRFPQALIEDLALYAGGPSETDLRELATEWLGSVGCPPTEGTPS